MKTFRLLSLTACVAFLLVGCASANNQEGSAKKESVKFGDTQESVLANEDVKKNPPTVFHQPIEKVREAGLRALTFVGCEIKEQHPYFLNGRRPNKFGLFVGSGGETVKIFMIPKDSDTQVWVDTDLSFVGIAGQQSWDKQTMAELHRILDNAPAPAAEPAKAQ